jgi:hypothetical protein
MDKMEKGGGNHSAAVAWKILRLREFPVRIVDPIPIAWPASVAAPPLAVRGCSYTGSLRGRSPRSKTGNPSFFQ